MQYLTGVYQLEYAFERQPNKVVVFVDVQMNAHLSQTSRYMTL